MSVSQFDYHHFYLWMPINTGYAGHDTDDKNDTETIRGLLQRNFPSIDKVKRSAFTLNFKLNERWANWPSIYLITLKSRGEN